MFVIWVFVVCSADVLCSDARGHIGTTAGESRTSESDRYIIIIIIIEFTSGPQFIRTFKLFTSK